MWRYYYWSWKDSVEDYTKTIDIKFLKKYWYLDKWIDYKSWSLYWKRNWNDNWNIWVEVNKSEFNWFVRVYFTQTSMDWTEKRLDYQIPLVSTPCNYWWVRWWFLCPCKWNRCSILYLQSNWIFASRKTLNLCYDEQKKSKRRRYLSYIMCDNLTKIYAIQQTMKYPVRNWKYTKKAQRILRLRKKVPTEEEVKRMNERLGW
jgi:hypothetical protein